MAINPERVGFNEDAKSALELLIDQADRATDLRARRISLTDRATVVAMSGKVRESCCSGLPRHGQKVFNCGTGFVQLDPSSEIAVALMEESKEVGGKRVRGVSLYLLEEGADPDVPIELAFFRGSQIDIDIVNVPEEQVLNSLGLIVAAIDASMEKDDGTALSPTYVNPLYLQDALEMSRLLREKGLVDPPTPLESPKL